MDALLTAGSSICLSSPEMLGSLGNVAPGGAMFANVEPPSSFPRKWMVENQLRHHPWSQHWSPLTSNNQMCQAWMIQRNQGLEAPGGAPGTPLIFPHFSPFFPYEKTRELTSAPGDSFQQNLCTGFQGSAAPVGCGPTSSCQATSGEPCQGWDHLGEHEWIMLEKHMVKQMLEHQWSYPEWWFYWLVDNKCSSATHDQQPPITTATTTAFPPEQSTDFLSLILVAINLGIRILTSSQYVCHRFKMISNTKKLGFDLATCFIAVTLVEQNDYLLW